MLCYDCITYVMLYNCYQMTDAYYETSDNSDMTADVCTDMTADVCCHITVITFNRH